MPHMSPPVAWWPALANGLIALACYTILIAIWGFRRKFFTQAPSWTFASFIVFLFALGTEELVDGWMPGAQNAWIGAANKAVTAVFAVLASGWALKLLLLAKRTPLDATLPTLNAQLRQEVEIRRLGEAQKMAESARLAAIVEAQRDIAAAQLDTAIVLNLVVERVQNLTAADGAVVEHLEGDEMVYRVASGSLIAYLGLRLHAGHSLSGLCVTTGEIQLCSDADIDPRVDREACRRIGLRSMIVVPLSHRGQRVGVLKVVSSRPNHFSSDDIHTLELMSELVASTTRHVQTLQENDALLRQRTQALKALATAEQRFHAFMDDSPVLAFLKDEEGRYEYCNRAFAELLGTRAADLKGKADFDVLPAAVADEIRRDDRRILEEDVAAENETTIPNQEGTTRQFVVLKFPLRDATGSRWLGGLAFDVTERKAAELRLREVTETLREQAALLDLTQDSVIVRDLDGRVRFWNGGAEQIYGWTREEAQGQSLLQLLRPEYQVPWDAIHGELLRQGRWEGEVVHHRRNGSPVTVASRWALQRDLSGAPMAVLEINNDVTQRKEAADHLARQSQLLESSNAELQQFAYIASHDMKEPLRIVASYAQLLGKRYHGQLDAKADGFIAYMVDGVQRMQRLIDDLLEDSRVGGQRVAGVTVSADMALRQALANLRLAIQETGANVSFDGLPQVIAEPGKLVQLFQNLVANAIKFHGTAAPVIAVEAEFAKGHWQFAVRDNGIGFEPKYAERIFTIFERLHGRGEHPGTGIGLAICKKIVEQFGGHIWAESQPGIGTTFYFTLPAVVSQGMSV